MNYLLQKELHGMLKELGAPMHVLSIMSGIGDTLDEEEAAQMLTLQQKVIIESDEYVLLNAEQASKRNPVNPVKITTHKTKEGNYLQIFYNSESNLLVVDLIDKSEKFGNEFVRITLDEKVMLKNMTLVIDENDK